MTRSSAVQLCRKVTFSSGYRYWRNDLSEAENHRLFGERASRGGFGHNFVLEAVLQGSIDPDTGMVVNLRDIDAILKQVVGPLDHHHLNDDVPYFANRTPTPENIAAYCYEQLQARLDGLPVSLQRVRLSQGSDLWVDYRVAR